MSIIEITVDLIPVVLAVVAIITLAKSYNQFRRSIDKFIAILASIAASVMLVAQLSWWASNILENRLVDIYFANYLWTVFNVLTMVIFILFARKRIK